MCTRPCVVVLGADVSCATAIHALLSHVWEWADVKIFMHPGGAGEAYLRRLGIPFEERYLLSEPELTEADLLFMPTPVKKQGLVVSAMEAARGRCPVVWLETLYGTARAGKLASLEPDHLIVLDEEAQRLYIGGARVHPLGFPPFDALAGHAALTRFRGDACRKLGVRPHERVVAFAASSSSQIEMRETLDPLLDALGKLSRKKEVLLVSQFHRADPDRERWQRYVEKQSPVRILPPGEMWFGNNIVAIPHAVVVQHSTAGIMATAAAGAVDVVPLFLLFPSVRAYLEGRGLRKPFYPPIGRGAAAVAWSKEDLGIVLESAILDSLHRAEIQRAAQEYFPNDGKAAPRVSKFLQGLLK